eukprot:1440216-Prorocentrum_lima.AAC.1
MEAHGRLLRLVAARSGEHFAGLRVAARRLKLPSKLAKKLANLEVTLAVVRHVTEPYIAALVKDVDEHLASDLASPLPPKDMQG